MMLAKCFAMVLTFVIAACVLQPDPEIVALLHLAETEPDVAAIVSIEQMIVGMLVTAGLAWVNRQIQHKHVGVHKCNRHGFGVAWSRFHRLGRKIWKMGFSWAAAAPAICIEDDEESSNADFTVEMQDRADGYGKQKLHEIKYASLGGSHLNQLNVAIDNSAPSVVAELTMDGRMSKHKVAAKDREWGKCLDQGLMWTVLDKKVEQLYPTLPNLIQRARNAVTQNHSEESIAELILEILSLAVAMEKKEGAADWAALQQIVLQSEPPHADWIPILCNWVIKYGEHSGQRVKDFVYICVPAGREINPEIFEAINKWPTDSDSTLPEVALAFVLAEYNCPEEKVESGVCRFFSIQRIASLYNQCKDTLMACETLLTTFKAWTRKMSLKHQWMVAYEGKVFCLIARMLINTSVPAELQDSDYESALFLVASEILSLPDEHFADVVKNKKNPWAEFAPETAEKKTTTQQAQVQSGRLIAYDSTGNAKGLQRRMLLGRGFNEGIHVVIQEGKQQAGDFISIVLLQQ